MRCRSAPCPICSFCGRGSRSRGENSQRRPRATRAFVERKLFDRLSDVQTPQGILAVFPFPSLAPDPDDPAPLALVLDRLRDPGNLGTLLRVRGRSGRERGLSLPRDGRPLEPEGGPRRDGRAFSHSAHPPRRRDAGRAAASACRAGCSPVRRPARPYDAINWTGAAALVIGGETEGIGPELQAWGTEEVGIPLARGVESLNAAVAGAVILFEAARQRRRGPRRRTRLRPCSGVNGARRTPIYRVCSRVFVDLTDEWMVDSASGPLV